MHSHVNYTPFFANSFSKLSNIHATLICCDSVHLNAFSMVSTKFSLSNPILAVILRRSLRKFNKIGDETITGQTVSHRIQIAYIAGRAIKRVS